MKSFQIILFLTVVILIGGIAALHWGESIEQVTAPIETIEAESFVDENIQPAVKFVEPGNYLVFQTFYISDTGEKDWANDDTRIYTFYRLNVDKIGSSKPLAFAQIEHPAEIPGALTSYVYGANILMHRYKKDKQDAVLGLNGDILEVHPSNWNTFHSSNGRYEISHTAGPDIADTDTVDVTIKDLQTKQEASYSFTIDTEDYGWPTPYKISNDGERILFSWTCGCDGGGYPRLWEVDVTTGEVVALHDLLEAQAWYTITYDMEARRLLSIQANSELGENDFGPIHIPVPPSTISILDLASGASDVLVSSQEQAWNRLWVDPEGNNRYIARLSGEGNELYLANFDDTKITQENYLTEGWVLDWVGDWIVVQDIEDLSLRLVSLTTREEISVDLEGESDKYIGSIEIE